MSEYCAPQSHQHCPLTLFRTHVDLAGRLTRHVCRDLSHEDREDGHQEALLALHHAAVDWRPDHPGGAAFESFAWGRIHGRLTNFRRAVRLRQADHLGDTAGEVTDPSSLSAQADNQVDVKGEAPPGISAEDWGILRARYVLGWSVERLAHEFLIPPKQAAYRVRRARERARASLSAQAE